MIRIGDLYYSYDKKCLEKAEFNYFKNIQIEDEVEIIESHVFINSYIYNIHFPKNIKKIKKYAFEHSTINNIFIENNIELEEFAFSNTFNLEQIDINTEIIPKWCFTGCGNTTRRSVGTNIKLKNTKLIDENAFCNCTIYKIIFSDTILDIATEAFKYSHFYNDTLILPEGLKVIENDAFAKTNLKHIYLPDTIEFISNLQDNENLKIHISEKTFKKLKIDKTDNIIFLSFKELAEKMSFKELNKYFLEN